MDNKTLATLADIRDDLMRLQLRISDLIKTPATPPPKAPEPRKPGEFADIDAINGMGLPFSYQALITRARKGQFPKPIKLAGKTVWRTAEVRKWIDERIAERDAK